MLADCAVKGSNESAIQAAQKTVQTLLRSGISPDHPLIMAQLSIINAFSNVLLEESTQLRNSNSEWLEL
jgi:hypothetical protein